MTCTGNYFHQLVNSHVWHTIFVGSSKIVDDCRRSTPGVAFGVPFNILDLLLLLFVVADEIKSTS